MVIELETIEKENSVDLDLKKFESEEVMLEEILVNGMELKVIELETNKMEISEDLNLNKFGSDAIEYGEKTNKERIEYCKVMELGAIKNDICKDLKLNMFGSDEILIEEMPVNTKELKEVETEISFLFIGECNERM